MTIGRTVSYHLIHPHFKTTIGDKNRETRTPSTSSMLVTGLLLSPDLRCFIWFFQDLHTTVSCHCQ